MPRLSNRNRYQRRTMLAMTVYVAVLLLVWPLARSAGSAPLKVLLALAPALPMFYVIVLMARYIRDSDELEQRTHLVGLGVAMAVVGALSMAGGFLAVAKALPLDGSVLIWVFPVMMAVYGAVRMWVARRYGMGMGCDDSGASLRERFLLTGGLMAAVAAYAWWRHDAMAFGVFCGMAVALVGVGLLFWLLRRGQAGEDRD